MSWSSFAQHISIKSMIKTLAILALFISIPMEYMRMYQEQVATKVAHMKGNSLGIKLSARRENDSKADYVNIGAIMEWQDKEERGSCEQDSKETNAKKKLFDIENSFLVDTDNTSNDS
nr:uncharacterized protein LOC105341492 isoform X3 [Crassostrea gigas]